MTSTGCATTALLAAAVLAASATAHARDVEIVYPPKSGVLNVVTDAGVDNTGKTDVTGKLQKILADRPRYLGIIYFPKGTYLVSGQLLMKVDRSRSPKSHSHGPWLVGQSRRETVIRLKDGTWPKAAYDLFKPDARGRYLKTIDKQVVLNTGDCTNTTFNKIVRNLTINIGKGNAGAIGVQYNTSNSGFLGEVDIVSEDGQGVAGLALAGVENGPGQIRNIRIRGFDIGLYNRTSYVIASSDVEIDRPNKLGMLNVGFTAGEGFSFRITRPGAVAIHNVRGGTLTLIGTRIKGNAPAKTAIAAGNKGMLYLRDIEAEGYAGVIESGENRVGEYYAGKAAGLFHKGKAALKLPIKKTPHLPDYEKDFTKWTSPLDHGAVGDGRADDTEAFRKAFNDPGKTHVVVPYGKRFRVKGRVTVGPDLVRIVGTSGLILSYADENSRIVIGEGKSPLVILDGIRAMPPVEVRTGRTVVICACRPRYRIRTKSKDKSVRAAAKAKGGYGHYFAGTGDVFLNDDAEPFLVSNAKQHVWVRHFNNELRTTPQIIPAHVKAGAAWILGWKSENLGQRARVEADGALEIFGFHNYRVGRKKLGGDWPIFEIIDGRFSCNILKQSGSQRNQQLVWETRDGEKRVLTVKNNPEGGNCTLYTGYKP
jgi:hypothetical protein